MSPIVRLLNKIWPRNGRPHKAFPPPISVLLKVERAFRPRPLAKRCHLYKRKNLGEWEIFKIIKYFLKTLTGRSTPTWDWIVKIEISLIFLLSLSNLNFYKILVKNWTIMKNFMPDFTCMVLQSVIQEKAFLKINFLIAMTSNIFNTQILLNLNFNEDLWNKILL